MADRVQLEEEAGNPQLENMETEETSEVKEDPIQPKDETKKDSGPKYLDLAFAMDCTGSMGSYIESARQNVRKIVEQIVSEEKADVHLALVEYRDHPPEDTSFVTKVHDFTGSVRKMKEWLDGCSAQGGGDCPEAVADALQQVYKLDWRPEATKVCVFIADAPPHGLGNGGDGFPKGCPDGIDPMEVAGCLSEKGISLYVVGCEPSISPYKDFFMAIAHMTGGQYVPLGSAQLLTRVITGGVQEEISLQQLMADVNQEVLQEFAADESAEVSEEELTRRVHQQLKSKGTRARKLQLNNADLPEATPQAQQLSSCVNMAAVRKIKGVDEEHLSQRSGSRMSHSKRRSAAPIAPASSSSPGFFGRLFSFGRSAPAPPPPPPGAMMASGTPPPPMMAGGAPPPPSRCLPTVPDVTNVASASASDIYGLVEDDISEAQVQRMVQKSVYSNQLNTRYKKKY